MAREFTPDPAVLKELAEDEKLLWTGAPEAFPIMTAENKKGLTARWLGCIVAAVILIVGYIVLSATKSMSIWVLIITLAIVAYLAGVPAVDRGNVYKKSKYYVTDRRVLIRFRDNELFSLPTNGVKRSFVAGQPGCVHLELGTCVGIKANKRRVASFAPKKDDKGNIIGMVLYNVEDNDTLRKIFS